VSKPGSAPSVNIFHLKNELQAKVLASQGSKPIIPKPRMSYSHQKRTSGSEEPNTLIDRIVVIGASTGGPPAIQGILTSLPGNLSAPIVIAQHMPKTFTNAFAQRLNAICHLRVKEATDEEMLQRSVAYICPGDFQTRIRPIQDNRFIFSIVPNELEKSKFAPCIDNLFVSAAENFGRKALGIILTGMGDDGVKGLSDIRGKGGLTIAQDKMTCVVYGMPKAAAERGAASRILPISQISGEIELSLR
jgi:two-component system, chemotaxis family, protein-glutamate methylesterase/glutaminase